MQVSEWSIEQVGIWLSALGLTTLAPAFQANAVDGRDLIHLTEEDMVEHLGMTPIQIAKVKRELQKAVDRASAMAGTVAPAVVVAPAPPPATVVASQNPITETHYSRIEEGNASVIQAKPDEAAQLREKRIIILSVTALLCIAAIVGTVVGVVLSRKGSSSSASINYVPIPSPDYSCSDYSTSDGCSSDHYCDSGLCISNNDYICSDYDTSDGCSDTYTCQGGTCISLCGDYNDGSGCSDYYYCSTGGQCLNQD